jgi:hypothetical protein
MDCKRLRSVSSGMLAGNKAMPAYMNSRPSVGYDDMWAKTILDYEVDASVKHLF